MREVYVLMRDVGEYEDRDTSPVLATLDKEEAEAWLAVLREEGGVLAGKLRRRLGRVLQGARVT